MYSFVNCFTFYKMGLLREQVWRDLQAYVLIWLGCNGENEGFRGEYNKIHREKKIVLIERFIKEERKFWGRKNIE